MGDLTTRVYRGVKGYWRRRRYQRLGGKNRDESRPNRRRRFWKIRVTPRLKLKLRFSPRKFIIQIRDGYVRMMMRLANSPVVVGGGGYAGNGIAGFGVKPMKEYDEKMLIEIYKSLAARHGQLVPIGAPQLAFSGNSAGKPVETLL